ncbi:hypothetical protein D3C75_730080 [compost metagenome]
MLQAFHRLDQLQAAIADGLARVAVLVDQAVDAPGQVVLQRVGRELGQGADAHLHFTHAVEAGGQRVGGDADEARGQAALRHERGLGVLGQLHDGLGGVHVFGQVEVVGTGVLGRLGHADGHVIRQGVEHGVLVGHGLLQGGAVSRIQLQGGDTQFGNGAQRTAVAVGDDHFVVAGVVQQLSDGVADVTSAKQEYVHCCYLRVRLNTEPV